jgi:hypothetical protein
VKFWLLPCSISTMANLRNSAESRHMEQELQRPLDEQQSHSEDLARQLEIGRGRWAQLNREIAGLSKAAGELQPEAGVVSLALFAGLGRNARPGARRLRLELGTDHPRPIRYHPGVLTAEGDLVWSRNALRERSTRIGQAVVITLPVALLTRKAYLVTLSGAAAGDDYARIGSYYFNITRK